MPGTLEINYAIPYETGAVRLHEIGQRAEAPDGSVFRYAEMGAVQGVANKLYQGAAAVSNWQDTEHTVALATGDTEISFFDDGTAFAVDEAAGGHIVVESAADLGHIYRIKSNIATASNETIMQLMQGVSVEVAVPVATGNHLTFTKCQWKDIIISPAISANSAAIAGIPRVVITKDTFGWLLTRGVGSVVVDTADVAVLVGNGVRAGQDEAGAVSVWDEDGTAEEIDHMPIGHIEYTAATSGFAQIYLQVE